MEILEKVVKFAGMAALAYPYAVFLRKFIGDEKPSASSREKNYREIEQELHPLDMQTSETKINYNPLYWV